MDTNSSTTHPCDPVRTLVLGGTGKTGRRVVQRLRASGVPTRIGSRAGDPAFDWQDRRTWSGALRDVEVVYLSFYPDLAVPGSVDVVGSFAERAADSGVRRLVLLSGRGEHEAQLTEQAVFAADADSTVVRASWFAQNFSESFLLDGVRAGVVALPVDGVREPFIDAEDIADVAVAALTSDGHAGRVYEVTGPRLLSFAEAVQEIATATGRDIRLEHVPMDRYASLMAQDGVPQDVVWLMTYLFTEVMDGRNATVSDGVQRALGRQPRDFRDYASRAAASGVWAAPAVGA